MKIEGGDPGGVTPPGRWAEEGQLLLCVPSWQGAKAVNFLLIYGGRPALLQERAKTVYGVDMSLEEATEALKTFFHS